MSNLASQHNEEGLLYGEPLRAERIIEKKLEVSSEARMTS